MDLPTNLPSFKDLYLPILVAILFWLFKKIFTPTQHFFNTALKKWRHKDLKRARLIRVDYFAIQRQLNKESALFFAFVLSASTALGIMLIIITQRQVSNGSMIYLFFYMIPPLVLEAWWLLQKDFVETVLRESSRLGDGFTRVISSRFKSPKFTKNRTARQEAINHKNQNKKTWKRVKQR